MTEQMHSPCEILAHFADGPAQLAAAVTGLAELDLNLAQAVGTWTIRQIVHHIVDGDDVWKICLKAALGNSNGVFTLQWYWEMPQDTWVDRWKYAERSIEPSLALFQASRRHVVQLIQQIPDAWTRSIHFKWPHESEGQISVGSIIELQANHAAGHIDDIHRIRQGHNLNLHAGA